MMRTDFQTEPTIEPFIVKDCALITLATAMKVQTLREFVDALQRVSLGSLDHHFWGRLLRPQFDEPEYNNDFASWAHRGLHDKPLAERLSMVVPSDFTDLESLRREVVEVVSQRLEESEMVPWAKADQQFHFLEAQIVVLDTGRRFESPQQIATALPMLSTGSIYYHFIDARSRTAGRCDDFSCWLEEWGEEYDALRQQLCQVDPYFSSLKEIRHRVTGIFADFVQEGP